jgi:shikimate dehydrogenase
MTTPAKLPQYAVFGTPIKHSLSPKIHATFAAQCGISMEYRAVEAPAENFASVLRDFAENGGVGANVTLPLKALALTLCKSLDASAERAGAVNTLVRAENAWHGANTDGIGLVRDLTQRQQLNLQGRRLLMIGAGGAARGVIAPLLDAGVSDLVIANRSLDKAQTLAQQFNGQACELDQLENQGAFDLIVHASSAGHGEFVLPSWPESVVRAGTALVDLSYGAASKPALAWASELDIVAFDGLGMLIEQAAEAFYLWHHQRPDTAPIWGMLRAVI